MTAYKTDISHVNKFDGSYFNIWKHKLTLIFKSAKFLPKVSEAKQLLGALIAIKIAFGIPTLPFISLRSISMWKDLNALSLTVINNCLENLIAFYIQSYKTFHLVRSKLINIFESQDIVIKMHLKDKLFNFKMEKTQNVLKQVHNFRAHLEQLLVVSSTILDDEVVIMLMKSVSLSYQSFMCSLQRQVGITFQSLITNSIQE